LIERNSIPYSEKSSVTIKLSYLFLNKIFSQIKDDFLIIKLQARPNFYTKLFFCASYSTLLLKLENFFIPQTTISQKLASI